MEVNSNTNTEIEDSEIYYISNNSYIIKKLIMFNDDIFIPEGKNKEDVIQKIANRLNKRKILELVDEYKNFSNENGNKKKDIKIAIAIKEYINKDIKNQKIGDKERKQTEYLNLGENFNESFRTLIVSRLFNYMGYPTFNTYFNRDKNEILVEKLTEDNPFKFDKPKRSDITREQLAIIRKQFEKARRDYIIKQFYKDKNTAKQFIKRNIIANFFGDRDVNMKNVVYNNKTKEVKHIDIAFLGPTTMFSLGNILEGFDYCSDLDIFNVMNNEDYGKEYYKDERIEDFTEFISVDFIKNTIKEEYFNFQRKLLLMDDDDLNFLTYTSDEEISRNGDFKKISDSFKNLFKLHQVKSFCWAIEQNNLHKLFNLSEDCEEKLQQLFDIKVFIEENKPKKPVIEILKMKDLDENKIIVEDYFKDYISFLFTLSKKQEYKDFTILIDTISKENEKRNFKNVNELFSNENMKVLENTLKNKNSVDFGEFMKNFSEELKKKDKAELNIFSNATKEILEKIIDDGQGQSLVIKPK